jgi:hypothetical protein
MTALPKAVEEALWDAGSGSTPTEEEAKVTEALRAAIAAAIREAEDEAIERVAQGVENATIGVWGWNRPTVAADVRSLKHAKEDGR